MKTYKTRKILLAFAVVLATSPVHAASCWVKEFNSLPNANVGPIPIAPEPPLVAQPVIAVSATHAESQAFNAATVYIDIFCDVQASYLLGVSPVATNTMMPVPALVDKYVGVTPGQKISFVSNP